MNSPSEKQAYDENQDISGLLKLWQKGDNQALEQLVVAVYEPLKRRANFYLRKERSNHIFSSIDLIHETFLALLSEHKRQWQGSDHFFSLASRIMRHILAHHANAQNTQKRGGRITHISLEDILETASTSIESSSLLKEALSMLAHRHFRKKTIVELAYFAGLTVEEISQVLAISPTTVKRDLRFSKCWLKTYFKKNTLRSLRRSSFP